VRCGGEEVRGGTVVGEGGMAQCAVASTDSMVIWYIFVIVPTD
jgi:hypothetical protein